MSTLNNQISGGEAGGWLDVVRQQVGSIRFGVVQVVVHDAHVVQVEKTEKVRFDPRPAEASRNRGAEGKPGGH